MAIVNWTLTGLIPTSGLLAWYLYDPATSADGNINDASGNARHIVQASNPPTLVHESWNGHPGWVFDGTTANPLATASSANIDTKHVFVFASHADAAFNLNRGLLSGKTSGDWLTSETSGTEFFSFGSGYGYRKSDTAYDDADMEAPMSGIPELIETTFDDAGYVTLDGIQIGRQRDLDTGARKWKGIFYECLIFNRILNGTERRQVMLYFNVKYKANAQGLPLYFPDASLLTNTTIIVPTRFREVPPEWEAITDSWRYEDGDEDFNEVAPNAPRRWEYNAQVVGGSQAQVDAYRAIFDGFNDAARRANAFYFRDKWGQVWDSVRVEDYARDHDAHKSWTHSVAFRLKTNTGTIVTTADADGEYILDGGIS